MPVVDYAGPGEPCAPGYFCPQDLDCMIPCLPGSVCVQSVHTGGGGDDLLSSFDDDFGLSSSTAVGLDDYYSLPDDYYNRLLDDDLLNTTANTDDLASVDDSVDLLFNPYSSEPCKYLLDGGSYHLASADSSSIFNSSLALTIGEANYNYRERCPGASSVYLCPGGYYCQTPLSAEKCTKGHYCVSSFSIETYFPPKSILFFKLLKTTGFAPILVAGVILFYRPSFHNRSQNHQSSLKDPISRSAAKYRSGAKQKGSRIRTRTRT